MADLSMARDIDLPPDDRQADRAYEIAMRQFSSRCLSPEQYLNGAIDSLNKSVALTPVDNTKLVERVLMLAEMLLERYSLMPSPEDLNWASATMTRAHALLDQTHPNYPNFVGALATLSDYRFRQYERSGNLEDLRNAIELNKQIIQWQALDSRARTLVHADLAQRYGHLYEREKQEGHLHLGVDHGQQAMQEAKSLPLSERAYFYGAFAGALFRRFEHLGNVDDIHQAILNGNKAVETVAPGDQDRSNWLNNLGLAYEQRFERLGDNTDLEQALQCSEKSLELTPVDDPRFPSRTNNFANQLGRRFELTGESEYLNKAIEKLRAITESRTLNASTRAMYLSNFSFLLFARFQREGNAIDLDEAIEKDRESVDVTPSGHADLPSRYNSLGTKLRHRHEQKRGQDDIDEAIRCGEEAINSSNEAHPYRSMWLVNLALSYCWRSNALGDLDKAINLTKESIRSLDDSPARATQLLSLGHMLILRSSLRNTSNDLDEALTYFKSAAKAQFAFPLKRIQATRSALGLLRARADWAEMRVLGEDAMELLPLVCGRYLTRKDQQQAVFETSGLAADLCSILLKKDQVHQALQQLELGKAILIGYTIDNHDDLEALEPCHQQLANRYRDLRSKLHLQPTVEGYSITERRMKERRDASYDMERCLTEIRQIKGHENFLRGLSLDRIKSCASEGPIVVINVTDIGSDAILVSTSEVRKIPLPGMRSSGAPAFISKGLRTFRSSGTDFFIGRDIPSERETDSVNTAAVLPWLWDSCVKVVLNELEPSTTLARGDQLLRVWWIGVGVASSLPFHAAAASIHKYDSANNALDRMVPSYTPSIKTLAYSRERSNQHARTVAQQWEVTVVTMTKTPGHVRLRGVQQESELIKKACKSSGFYTCVQLPQPTVDTALESIAHSKIVHFACHGMSHGSDPSKSHLLLQKDDDSGEAKVDELTVSRISSVNRTSLAWISYLSACSTASINATGFGDEGIHISSALQVAGFAHVIGSQWRLDDDVCVKVAGKFYEVLIGKEPQQLCNRAVAEALRAAVLHVRGEDPDPLRWGGYIHSGA